MTTSDPTESDGAQNSAPRTPDEWVQWFSDHPWLEAGAPRAAEVAGSEGVSLDTVTKGGKVGLFSGFSAAGRLHVSQPGTKTRWYVVPLNHQHVVIGAWAKSAKIFDESIDEMEAVVQSLDLSPDLEPIPLGPLEAGTTYATSSFAVPMALRVGGGWKAPYVEHRDEFEIHSVGEDHGLVFFAGGRVACSFPHWPVACQTGAPGTAKAFASWLAEHPQLEAVQPYPAILDGVEGFAVETVTKGYHGDEDLCDPCAPLFWLTSPTRNAYLSKGGEQTRWYMVDVDGRAFVVGAWAESPQVFDDSIEEMEQVLNTVRFAEA